VLKIQRSSNGQVVFTISGRIAEDDTADLETLINEESKVRPIVLDLKDVTIVNQDAVNFLERCEADGITLKNCPAYIREWITIQQRAS
jgi:anti-anti-sigma regulatory factor